MSCWNWKLYAIIDRGACAGRDFCWVAKAALTGGVDVIQLRDKQGTDERVFDEAMSLLKLTRSFGVPLIINDRVAVAAAVGAEGVHLGQDDTAVDAARQVIGPDRLVGKSTHSLEQALAAQNEGADYIGFGPIFPTPTKPSYGSIGSSLISDLRKMVSVPAVCIGGIDSTTLDRVIDSGANCVAVVRALCTAADPESAARTIKDRMLARVSIG